MYPLSVVEQDAGIRRLFPKFRQTCALDFLGIWRGPLCPLAKTYEVRLTYCPRIRFGGAIVANPWITVEVVNPLIGLDPRGTDEPPPHIYRRPETAAGWSMCLYDPRRGDWQPDLLISETVIPWAAEWLFFYEGWLIDGQWAGGGEHPIAPKRSACPTNQPCPDQRVPSLRDAYRRSGRLTGTSVSSLSMEVASEEFSRPASLPIWKPVQATEIQSPAILISSRAHRQAASLPWDWGLENLLEKSATSTFIAGQKFFPQLGTTSLVEAGRHFATTS